jgi:hypothetical protein
MARFMRLSHVSAPRQALMRLCQSVDYGQIIDLHIRDGEPVFNPEPTLLLDLNLDSDCNGRPESELADFILCEEFCRLLDRIDALRTGRIQRIEARAGIPRRVLIQRRITDEPR